MFKLFKTERFNAQDSQNQKNAIAEQLARIRKKAEHNLKHAKVKRIDDYEVQEHRANTSLMVRLIEITKDIHSPERTEKIEKLCCAVVRLEALRTNQRYCTDEITMEIIDREIRDAVEKIEIFLDEGQVLSDVKKEIEASIEQPKLHHNER